MPTTRKSTKPLKPSRFVKTDHWIAPSGRHLDASEATELTVEGRTGGRFRFICHVTDPTSGEEWIDTFGPIGRKGKSPQIRSFPIDRIKTIHTKVTAR